MRFSALLWDIQKVDILSTYFLSQCRTSITLENIRKPEISDALHGYRSKKILVVNMLRELTCCF